MAELRQFRCRCPAACVDLETYRNNHIESIEDWGEQMDKDEFVTEREPAIVKMIRDEPFARRRVELRDKKIAAGWVPRPPPQPSTKPKPICKKCTVVDGKVVASACINKKCTFNHGCMDRRAHIRMAQTC